LVEGQHFVRFIISDGERARPKFKCEAPEDADCRTLCKTCLMEEDRERCECDSIEIEHEDGTTTEGREPDLLGGQDCNVLNWLQEEPDEAYNGPTRPVNGPDWAPIKVHWENDYFTWIYAEDNDLFVPQSGRAMSHITGDYHNVGLCHACQQEKAGRERYRDVW
jgi:hypothetical protein